jgi:regulator of sirC expression with transglutaminase-like and TPR domain
MGPTARFTQLVQGPEDELALDEAALLIAAHAYPDLDVARELGRLDELAAACPSPATIESWRRYLFVDLGFGGETGRYYDARNSFLNDVLDSRRGIPISLAVLGIEVGRRVGLRFDGVGMPGHFLLRSADSPDIFIDPFHGGAVLDRLGCVQRFNAVNPPTAPFLGAYLDPVGRRAIVGRILQNLKGVYSREGNTKALRWVFDLRLAIPGTPPLERRDGARLQAAGGRFDIAADQLEDLADSLPDSAADLLVEARALRARLN